MKVSTLLIVSDLCEAKQFYVGVLGLKVIDEKSDRIDLDANGHEIHIFKGINNATSYNHSVDASSTLVFWVNDLNSKIKELESHGYKIIHRNENDFSKYAAFWGPSGIVHEIAESST